MNLTEKLNVFKVYFNLIYLFPTGNFHVEYI